MCFFSLHRILTVPSAMARQRSVCASSFGRRPAVTRLIASASRSHAETYGMKPLSLRACDCGASFESCGLGIVGSVGIFTRIVCSIAGCLPRRSCKALAVGQLSAIVTWGGENTLRTPGAPRRRPSISVPTIEAVLASNNASQEQRSMPGYAPHSRCPHKRSCCYFLRLKVGFASSGKPQSSIKL